MTHPSEHLPEDLRGRYRADAVLGAGGFGVVLAARDLELDRDVALKLLHGLHHDPDARARVDREARATAAIEHPGVVRVHDSGQSAAGHPYVAYELVRGPTLRQRLEAVGPMGDAAAATLGVRLAEALHACHRRGIVHRDVKPDNILLRDGGEPVLCDFGIAAREGGVTVHTPTGFLMGTPRYMAPEVLRGEPAGPASDVFALGAVLWEATFGRPLHRGVHPADVLASMEDPRTFVAPAVPGVSPWLARTLERAVAADPARRFRDAAALASALAQDEPQATLASHAALPVVEADPSAVTPGPFPPAPAALAPRPPGRPWVAIVAWLGLALVVLSALAPWPGARPPPGDPGAALASEAASAADAAEQAAAADLAEAYRRLSRGHLDPGGALIPHDKAHQHARAVEPLLFDPRFGLRWSNYLKAAVRWLHLQAAAASWDQPATLQQLEQIARITDHLGRDLDQVHGLISRDALGGALIGNPDEVARNQQAIEARTQFHEDAEVLESLLPTITSTSSSGLLRVRLLLDRAVYPASARQTLDAAMTRLERDLDQHRLHLDNLYMLMADMTTSDRVLSGASKAPLRCEETHQALSRLAAILDASPRQGPRLGALANVFREHFLLEEQIGGSCQNLPDPEQVRRVCQVAALASGLPAQARGGLLAYGLQDRLQRSELYGHPEARACIDGLMASTR